MILLKCKSGSIRIGVKGLSMNYKSLYNLAPTSLRSSIEPAHQSVSSFTQLCFIQICYPSSFTSEHVVPSNLKFLCLFSLGSYVFLFHVFVIYLIFVTKICTVKYIININIKVDENVYTPIYTCIHRCIVTHVLVFNTRINCS